jgi:predicted flap endonuclease-1-like 5' DNA nuclease
MVYLLRALSDWSAAALALGVVFGLFAGDARPRAAAWAIWTGLGASLYVAGAVAAYLEVAPGRYGFWLETALLLLSCYGAGYGLGALLRWPFVRSHAPAAAPVVTGPERPSPRGPYGATPQPEAAAAAAVPAPQRAPAFADDLSRIHGLDRAAEDAAPALRKILPGLSAPQAHDALYPGLRPLALTQPPQDAGDDLEKIAGIDAATAERLNALGVWTYAQIARWSADNVRWAGAYLAFPGRIEREGWVGQAQALLD